MCAGAGASREQHCTPRLAPPLPPSPHIPPLADTPIRADSARRSGRDVRAALHAGARVGPRPHLPRAVGAAPSPLHAAARAVCGLDFGWVSAEIKTLWVGSGLR
eukprot:299077-Chlamydomonas_euryale.AAC.1